MLQVKLREMRAQLDETGVYSTIHHQTHIA
jgi:hypothetical protein